MSLKASQSQSGLPSPAEMASKLFGYSDPESNAEWSDKFDQFSEQRDERERTGFVDTLQQAAQMSVGAVSHLKETGQELAADLGEETGLFPGHMSKPEPEEVKNVEPEKSPEEEFSAHLVNRITSKFNTPEESASKGPRLLNSPFD